MTELTDNELGELLRAEVPAPADGYWESVNAMIDNAATTRDNNVAHGASVASANAGEPGIDISQKRVEVPSRSRLARRVGRAAPVAIAATLLLIVGLTIGTRTRGPDGSLDLGTATERVREVIRGEEERPRAGGVDHWHAVYGVWDCTANSGDGDWLPKFSSSADPVGIHSHDDGMIYIHPFDEQASGRNATFSHFVSSMQFELTDQSITLPDGRKLREGASCNGSPATVHLRRWTTAEIARVQPPIAPQIITQNLNGERFYNDREVWVLAFAPLGANIPLPPAERFAELDNWSNPAAIPPDLEVRPATTED